MASVGRKALAFEAAARVEFRGGAQLFVEFLLALRHRRRHNDTERCVEIAGKGLPKPGGGAGDLYAVLSIVVPPAMSEREKKLYEELRGASKFDPRSRFKR